MSPSGLVITRLVHPAPAPVVQVATMLAAKSKSDALVVPTAGVLLVAVLPVAERSEEHTSELQSQSNLVCRLLLEKKKKTRTQSESLSSRRRQKVMTMSRRSAGVSSNRKRRLTS